MKKNKYNYLDNIPVINGDIVWNKIENMVVIDQEHKGFYNFLAQKIFHTPRISKVKLDDFGSFVWLQMDGSRTIYDIGKLVSNEFGKDAEPLYERLIKFFYTLKDVNFVSFQKKVGK